jgi:hypothetical protein
VGAFYREAGGAQAKMRKEPDEWRGADGLTKLLHSHTMPRAVLPLLFA